ncbi:MAG: ABC transporter permease [Erysipelotrichia bacterium]|nr:ABC transporter permease [Erysipelotrichia bacterium]NCC54654.1 ABC transporter permease [Erysipelotrichia bacterium]
MKVFATIFKFELFELMKSKAYKITTILFLLIAVIGLSLPTIFPSMLQSDSSDVMNQFNEKVNFALYDEKNVLASKEIFSSLFPKATIQEVSSVKEMETLVQDKKVDAGFHIQDELKFDYYVLNSDMVDMKSTAFGEVLTLNYKNKMLINAGVNAQEANAIANAHATFTTHTLGSDGANNIMYTFILIMVIYMVIILYGNSIATSVASEKGNRTMELLVTSANPNALIFGKVLAGCLAAIIQIGLLIASAKLMYTLNGEAWNGMLDFIFNIPMDVLGAFAIFGIFGFIFYAFIFGALGALVSKSEDVNSSSTPITIVFIVIYFVVYTGVMSDPSSLLFTITSFVPFSSPMAMFARMAMVDVPFIEVLISLAILIASTIIIGMGAAKIYRRATLMYGNQIKLSQALKWFTKK